MYYPRSFLKFILLGFLLVSLPLVYALAELILSLDRLQAQGQQAVQQAAEAGRASRQLYEHTATLERIVRQYLILEDAALLEDYEHVRQEMRQAASQLALLPLAANQQEALRGLKASEEGFYPVFRDTPSRSSAMLNLADGYAKLSQTAQGLLTASNDLTERAIGRLQEIGSEGREKWSYLALATAAIACALAIFFAVLIARPIRQLDQAIRRMGTADFTHPIEVNGPQDLRYLGQRLEWLRSRLADLEEQQARFLRHVSHELKTPLTAVREGSELLRDRVGGDLSPAQMDIVRIVRENCLQLQKLIEDLLKYQQSHAIETQAAEPLVLMELVREVLREHKLAALARMVTFDVAGPPLRVLGRADKIRTIVDNLVSNAIKYSPFSGAITLRVATDGDTVTLDVSDEGTGVAPGERERIFESFYQGAAPVGGRVKGSGLGLAIAREYAHAHQGDIEVRERKDGRRGASFRFWLPLAPTVSADVAPLIAAIPPGVVAPPEALRALPEALRALPPGGNPGLGRPDAGVPK